MPLQIDYVSRSTGATAGYHVVQRVELDYESEITSVTVASYLNKGAREVGKFPMYAQQIQIASLPDGDEQVRNFAETTLSAAPPVDGGPSANPARYAFAGAVIAQ